MNAKTKAVVDRIKSLEEAIHKATEYLESGKHADWHGFRPLFHRKLKDAKELPPHKDWVKNVYRPGMNKALARAEKLLERFDEEGRVRTRDNHALQRTAGRDGPRDSNAARRPAGRCAGPLALPNEP